MDAYNSLNEMMSYFHLNFIVYFILLLIVIINCLKTIANYMRIKKDSKADLTTGPTDIGITLLCGTALFFALYFQGVLADVSGSHSEIWFPRVFALSIISLLLLIVQLRFLILIADKLQSDKGNK